MKTNMIKLQANFNLNLQQRMKLMTTKAATIILMMKLLAQEISVKNLQKLESHETSTRLAAALFSEDKRKWR